MDVKQLFDKLKKKKELAKKVKEEKAKAEEKTEQAQDSKSKGPTKKIVKSIKTEKVSKGKSTGGPRQQTEDGYKIYTLEELGLDKAKGGDTPDCPFDCSCCF